MGAISLFRFPNMQGLTVWLFLHWEITLMLLNAPYLAWTVMMFLDRSYLVDPSKVYTREFKKGAQQKVLIAMGFFAVMFFVYLASMVSTIISVGGKR
jgi:hypothetical protein